MEQRPLAVGTLLKGKYRITRLVAGGGMAWVYEAEEPLPNGSRQIWAVKELRGDPDDAHSREEARALFEGEANILVRLHHPNLPGVSAFFEENGRSYLVMEFIHGESLQKTLDRANSPLLEAQVLDWAVQICDVLSYLHGQPQPVIFRDMKPSNVMVTPDGQAKLIDFGIARTFKAGKRKDTITMGSENYAAPEQWGKAQTDARADVYGVGATMYHLLTNVPPLPAFVPTPRVGIQQYNPAVSLPTVAAVERALSEDRADRFSSAEEMRQALMACLPARERRRLAALSQQRSLAAAPGSQADREPAEDALQTIGTTPTAARVVTPATAPDKPCPSCASLNRAPARFCRRCGHAFVAPRPPVLTVLRPTQTKWEYPLRDDETWIGRRGGSRAVDLDLGFYDPDGYISRNHARIAAHQRRYQIIDLASANGTYVNGQPLRPNTPYWLRHEDRIRMGRVVVQFRIR